MLASSLLRSRLVSPRRHNLSTEKLTYFSAWFCPFAHRTTLALAHHGKEYVDYDWVEALGWETRKASGQEKFDAAEREEWQYHWKHPDLLSRNPEGMIPTLASGDRVATESVPCLELIDSLARAKGSPKRLVPEDPWFAAHVRVWAEKINKTSCSEYYKCLVRESKDERSDAFDRLVAGLEAFTDTIPAGKGPFFSGLEEPSLVDFVLLPYAFRFYVLAHYRDFHLPQNPTYDKWLSACLTLPGIHETLPDKDRYLKHIDKYASGKARSKVANAVRRGANAHDYDHTLDTEKITTPP